MTRARTIANFGDGIATADIGDGQITTAKIASGAITDALLPTGTVLQVVQDTHSTLASTTGTTFVATGLSASITPVSASSSILILVTMNGIYNGSNSVTAIKLQIKRGATVIHSPIVYTNFIGSGVALITSASANYIDTPSTTSSTTYTVDFARSGGSGQVDCQANSDTSSITLLEIAG